MIQRKHTFRLRIPWLFAPSSRVSKAKDGSTFPTHSETNVPIQRPISPTTRTNEPSNSEPQKMSPSHHTQPTIAATTSVIIESSSVPSQTRIPTPFHSPLPSRAGSPSHVSIASSSPKTRPQSPFHLAPDGIIQVGKPDAEESFWPASSAAFEREKENKVVSEEPLPEEAEPKPSSPLRSMAKSPQETTFQPEKMKTQPQDTEKKASSAPLSPVSKTELSSDQHLPCPPLASEHTDDALSCNADESALPASPASQEEKEMLVPQETESKEKSQLEAINKSPETSFWPENMSKQPQESEQKTSSEPSTPVSKTEPPSDQPPHTSSPLASKHTGEMLKHNAEENALPKSPTPQEEKEKVVDTVSEPVPQEAEPKLKSPLKTILKSPETSFHPSSVPSSPVSKIEPASHQPPHPPSPLVSGHIDEALNPGEENPLTASSSVSQEETQKMAVAMSEPTLQDVELKMKSPLKTILTSSETTFHPSSVPLSLVSKIESASHQPPHPSSPLTSNHIGEALNPGEESPLTAPYSASQEETQKMAVPMSKPAPQDVEFKMKSPLKTIPKSPENSSKPEILYTRPTLNIGDVKKSPTPETKKSLNKLLESVEKKKRVHEPIKARKANDIRSIVQPILHTMESASSGSKDKDPFKTAFREDKKQQEARKTVARRLVFATSKLRERDLKFMSSGEQITRTVSSILVPEKSSLQNGITKDVSKFVHKLAIVDRKGIEEDVSEFVQKLDMLKQPKDGKQSSAITLTGENRGATMQLSSDAAKKDDLIHIHQDYKADPEEITEENTEKDYKDDGVGKAYVNSNVQSINNSLMVHGSITESW